MEFTGGVKGGQILDIKCRASVPLWVGGFNMGTLSFWAKAESGGVQCMVGSGLGTVTSWPTYIFANRRMVKEKGGSIYR
jgi:hypothetical protein